MTLAALTAVLLSASTASAAAGVQVAVHAPELAPKQRDAVGKATERVLSEVTAFEVRSSELSPRACDDVACLRGLSGENAPLVVSITASVPNLVLELKGALFDAGTGAVIRKTVRGGNPDAPEEAVRTLLEALLPKWTQKGFASIAVKAPDNSVVKVDGRRVALVPLGDALPVVAGVHDVDVVFPDGQAVMFRRKLDEGVRFTAEAAPTDALKLIGTRANARPPAVRYASYALWSAGALAVAGSLIAGGLSQATARDLKGCDVDTRNCLRIDEANRMEARAQRYANTANVLLAGGITLGAAGAGVFVFDLGGE